MAGFPTQQEEENQRNEYVQPDRRHEPRPSAGQKVNRQLTGLQKQIAEGDLDFGIEVKQALQRFLQYVAEGDIHIVVGLAAGRAEVLPLTQVRGAVGASGQLDSVD